LSSRNADAPPFSGPDREAKPSRGARFATHKHWVRLRGPKERERCLNVTTALLIPILWVGGGALLLGGGYCILRVSQVFH